MFPEFSSEYIQSGRVQSIQSNLNVAFQRRTRNPSKETFEKLASKLKERDLPGSSSRRDTSSICIAGTDAPTPGAKLHLDQFFPRVLESRRVTHLEGVSRKHIEAFIEHEQDRG